MELYDLYREVDRMACGIVGHKVQRVGPHTFWPREWSYCLRCNATLSGERPDAITGMAVYVDNLYMGRLGRHAWESLNA